MGSARLEFTVLTRLFLQVEIEVAVVVAGGLVVQGGIGHAELLADRGHEVGGLIDGGVGERLVQMFKSHFVIADGMIAGGQRSMGAGNLIDVTIVLEEQQGLFCQFHVAGMVGQRLLGLCLEIGIVVSQGNIQAARQTIHLLLIDFLLAAVGDDATSAHVVEVIKELSRVAAHLIRVDSHKGVDGLALEAYIIIIGGIDDAELRLGIAQTLLLAGVELVALLVDTFHTGHGTLAEIVEVLVARTALTQTHLLDVTYQEFQLVVSHLGNLVQIILCGLIIHPDHLDKGQVVQSFSSSFRR